ncbi:MAG TPA: hypothetical protein VGC01_00485, partial [Mucilaginibacter sp.]
FKALKKGLLSKPEVFNKLKFYFIGTSYAPSGTGTTTILPLAIQYGVNDNVIEITDRISYYHTILTLQQADALFIPGSEDPKYTASKIYPYMQIHKPLLAIFNKNSSAVATLNECTDNAIVLTFNENATYLADTLYQVLLDWGNNVYKFATLTTKFENYSAKTLTGKQTELFIEAINHFETKNTNA